MGGSELQLVSKGKQDAVLTHNPEITFFKVIYRKHANFSIESSHVFMNQSSANLGQTVNCVIPRRGDLLHSLYIRVTLKNSGDPTVLRNVGYSILRKVSIEIGGQTIDAHTGEWLHIWNELSEPLSKRNGLDHMVGKTVSLQTNETTTLYIPLQFWFCREYGQSLPLIALQYHEVKLNIELNEVVLNEDDQNVGDHLEITDFVLLADYIILDTDERRTFAKSQHEYLIDQVQHPGSHFIELRPNTQTPMTNHHSIFLRMNHPMKELVWVVKQNEHTLRFLEHNEASIVLNGFPRQAERIGKYYSTVQPYQHHTNIPSGDTNSIHVFSFAISPQIVQPTGTCNFSKINKGQLFIKTRPEHLIKVINVYGLNLNVFRIVSGMGGVVFTH